MAQTAARNGVLERESFKEFFERWLLEQSNQLEELVKANNDERIGQTEEHAKSVLTPLLQRVIKHYESYYETKSKWAKHDVLSMFHPSWRSNFEDAFLWVGGWRPSMAFHLLYSKSGLQLEAGIVELFQGLRSSDLGGLSADQLGRINELQLRTIREEREITEDLAKHQETIADSSTVELSHIASEIMRANHGEGIVEENRIETTLAPKEEGLVGVLKKADELRIRTLKEVLDVLTQIQSAHFLIAAAELHVRLHDWGMKRDVANQGHAPPPPVTNSSIPQDGTFRPLSGAPVDDTGF